jgi:hypothetical protein
MGLAKIMVFNTPLTLQKSVLQSYPGAFMPYDLPLAGPDGP